MSALSDDALKSKASFIDESRSAIDDLREKVHELNCEIDRLKKDARRTAHAAEDLVTRAGQDIHDLAYSAKNRVTGTASAISDNVHNKPVQTACVALVIGFFAALVYRR